MGIQGLLIVIPTTMVLLWRELDTASKVLGLVFGRKATSFIPNTQEQT